MESERTKLERIIGNMSPRQQSDDRLFFDKKSKSIRTGALPRYPDGEIEITPEDLTFSGLF